jgi:acyl carrier protein
VEYVAPGTALETVIAGVWAEVLGIDRAGARDDFFELGGHSLSATRIVSRLAELLGVPLRLRDLFAHPSPADLARRMEAIGREEGLDVAGVAEVLAEVGGLSDADVERLLAEEEGRPS